MQEETLDSINRRLKAAREQAGLTLAQLAQRTGYALTTLSGVENGHDRPSKRLLRKWIEALELNEQWLSVGEDATSRRASGEVPLRRGRNLGGSLRSRIRKARQCAVGLMKELDQMEKDLARESDSRSSHTVRRKPPEGTAR